MYKTLTVIMVLILHSPCHVNILSLYLFCLGKECPKPSWQESMKMLGNIAFLQNLQNYPVDTINAEMLDLMEPIMLMVGSNERKY